MKHDEKLLLADFLEAMKRHAKVDVLTVAEEVAFETDDGLTRLDATVEIRLPKGEQRTLAVEVLRSGFPRDVRLAALKLMNHARAVPESMDNVVVAPSLSPGSRQALREHGFNFFDSSGTLVFHAGSVVVDREFAHEERAARVVGSLFTAAREQVAHALLHHWSSTGGQDLVSGAELVELSQTSAYTVSHAMQEMERQDWVEAQGAGPLKRRRLRAPAALLDAWARAWQARRESRSRWYTFVPKSSGLLDYAAHHLGGHDDWAVTGAAAANVASPLLTHIDRLDLVVKPGGSAEVVKRLKLREVDKGANVVLVERTGASWLFTQDVSGARSVSKFIQYLDLQDGVGRNKELARELRREVLKIGEDEEEER